MEYSLYTDGGSRGNPGPAACAFFLMNGDQVVDFGGEFLGEVTNNVAEYRGLIYGLKKAIKLKVKDLKVRMDSELVIKQIKGEYKISNNDMKKLSSEVKKLSEEFSSIEFEHVRREENKNADRLVNQILDLKN